VRFNAGERKTVGRRAVCGGINMALQAARVTLSVGLASVVQVGYHNDVVVKYNGQLREEEASWLNGIARIVNAKCGN